MRTKFFILISISLFVAFCSSCTFNSNKQDGYIGNKTETNELNKTANPYMDKSDYQINCYFKDVDYMQCLENKKIKLIPTMEITYEQYAEALANNNKITLDGKTFTIDASKVEICYYVDLIGEFNTYSFDEPNEEFWPVSVVYNYFNREPIEVAISDKLIVRYGVLGYNEKNEPYGYEPLGRKTCYTAEEYFPHFEEYSFYSYYRATIKNGELVILDVLYRP